MAGKIDLQPIAKKEMRFGIVGTSPLIMHAWSEKALRMMREKHAGKKTKARDVRDPQQEMKDATYTTEDGDIGIPGMAFKSALVTAAHKDIGVEKTMVRKALFLVCNDPGKVLPIQCSEPVMREDCVRVGAGSADLRYRPEFREWSCIVTMEVDSQLLQEGDVLALVDRAGFGVGICEWRPEKGGEYGRFKVDDTVPITFG